MKKCMILFALLIGCLWTKAQSVVPHSRTIPNRHPIWFSEYIDLRGDVTFFASLHETKLLHAFD